MQIAALPTTVLVASDGKILYRQVGFGPDGEAQLRRAIEDALGPDDAE
jgi:hypothetical protein